MALGTSGDLFLNPGLESVGQGGNNWNSVSPDSTIGKAIAADADGVRENSYRNTINDLKVLSGKQTFEPSPHAQELQTQ